MNLWWRAIHSDAFTGEFEQEWKQLLYNSIKILMVHGDSLVAITDRGLIALIGSKLRQSFSSTKSLKVAPLTFL